MKKLKLKKLQVLKDITPLERQELKTILGGYGSYGTPTSWTDNSSETYVCANFDWHEVCDGEGPSGEQCPPAETTCY